MRIFFVFLQGLRGTDSGAQSSSRSGRRHAECRARHRGRRVSSQLQNGRHPRTSGHQQQRRRRKNQKVQPASAEGDSQVPQAEGPGTQVRPAGSDLMPIRRLRFVTGRRLRLPAQAPLIYRPCHGLVENLVSGHLFLDRPELQVNNIQPWCSKDCAREPSWT